MSASSHSYFACAPPDERPSVYIVEPQRLFLRSLLSMLSRDFRIVGHSDTVHGLYDACNVDLVLIDADMISLPMSQVLRCYGDRLGDAAICLLSLVESAQTPQIFGGRVCRHISKSSDPSEMIESIARVARRTHAMAMA